MRGTIVVGIDASAPSRAAVDWATARAVASGLAVLLIHVIDERWLGLDDNQDADVRGRARTLLDAELERARPRVPATTLTGRIVVGRPPQALMDASFGADLLVIGTHKTGFTYGRAFGSAFLALVSQAPCAVAVIPEFRGRARRGVVAGADHSDSAMDAIEFATVEAARSGQDLVLVAAWDSGANPGHHSERVLQRVDDRAVSLAAAASTAEDVESGVMVRSRMSDGVMAEALIAASVNAAVLVRPRPGPDPDDQTSAITNDVLANISSPVIIIGPHVEGSS